jgi:hypothetical protein
MSIVSSSPRGGHGWQLILADLALILFLLTLSALPSAEATSGRRLADSGARETEIKGPLQPEIAPAQALYRPLPKGPSLSQWLAAQAPDPRATLTIIAAHRPGGEGAAWTRAQALAKEARAAGTQVRTIITVGAEDEIYASLAYDALMAETKGGNRAS